jgi:predicted ATPase
MLWTFEVSIVVLQRGHGDREVCPRLRFSITKGWPAPQAEQAYARARQLGEQIRLMRGEPILARDHVEQGNAFYDHRAHRAVAFRYGQNPGVLCLAYAGLAWWMLGYPDRARQRLDESLSIAQDLSHPYTLGIDLFFMSVFHQHCRDQHATRDCAEAMFTLGAEQELAIVKAGSTIMRGWAIVAPERAEEGVDQLRQGITAWRGVGAGLFWPYYLSLLAEGYGVMRRIEDALATIAEALGIADQMQEHCWEAELHRLKGEFLLQLSLDNRIEAESCFHQALDIARSQQAKSWELRAATSLARLWQSQGKRQDTYDLLAPVYGWFTEGFDTADLKDAAAQLQGPNG